MDKSMMIQATFPKTIFKTMHAFYSFKASEKWGVDVFKNVNGEEVSVTALFPSKEYGEKCYAWKDKVYVGVVVLPAIRSCKGSLSDSFNERC
jgi:hypothetical protein